MVAVYFIHKKIVNNRVHYKDKKVPNFSCWFIASLIIS